MKLRRVLISGWVALALMLIFSTVAGAEVVGRLTQLEGRVELLKGGKLPAVPLKLDDTVEPGDIIRTKSLSKAQITFIDNSLLTLSQESRIAIEEFKFDPGQEKRHAVLQIFQGLALAVVNKILKAEEPDFVIKTQTAIVGVRGTEIGMRNQPNSSTILNFQGRTQVGNIFPEVSRLFLKAFKVAFSKGSWNNGSSRWVLLQDMQGTTVARNLPPTVPFTITPQDQMMFMRQLTTYAALSGRHNAPGAPVTPASGSTITVGLHLPGSQTTVNNLTTVTVPPKVVPQVQTAPPAPPPPAPPPPPPPTPTPTHTPTSPSTTISPGMGS
jgi:FecR protein